MIETFELLEAGESVESFTRQALTSFGFFERRVLQRDVMPHHLALYRNFCGRKRSVNLVFRGSGKTTILGVDYPLWRACRDAVDRRKRPGGKPMLFMVTSAAQRQSYEIIRAITSLVRDYEFLNWLRGDGVWTKRQLEFSNGAEVYSEVWNDNMRGRHVTDIFCDEASLYVDKNIFYSVVEPMAFSYGANLALAGTPMSEYDLMAELAENRSGQYFVERTPVLNDKGGSAWPARFSLSELDLIRERIGYANFAREYLLEILTTAERLFPANDIAKCLSRDIEYEHQRKEGALYFIGEDLASSPTGDYTAIAILRREGEKLVLAHMNRYRGLDFSGHLALAEEYSSRFRPIDYTVDLVPFGKQLAEEARRVKQVDMRTFDFTQRNRMDALQNLARLFSVQGIMIPRGSAGPAMQATDSLIHELSGIVPSKTPAGILTYKSVTKHDDMVMALAIAAFCANKTQIISGSVAKVIKAERRPELSYDRPIASKEEKVYSMAKVIKKPKQNYLEASDSMAQKPWSY